MNPDARSEALGRLAEAIAALRGVPTSRDVEAGWNERSIRRFAELFDEIRIHIGERSELLYEPRSLPRMLKGSAVKTLPGPIPESPLTLHVLRVYESLVRTQRWYDYREGEDSRWVFENETKDEVIVQLEPRGNTLRVSPGSRLVIELYGAGPNALSASQDAEGIVVQGTGYGVMVAFHDDDQF